MAKHQNTYAKRSREAEKRRKAEEKRQRRAERKNVANNPPETSQVEGQAPAQQ